jgi:hypothetical protein
VAAIVLPRAVFFPYADDVQSSCRRPARPRRRWTTRTWASHWLSIASTLTAAACSGSAASGAGGLGDGGGTGATGDGGSTTQTEGGSRTGPSGGGDGGSSSSGDGSTASGALGSTFRHGINMGFPNSAFTDNDDGLLSAESGADSNRIKLPEYFLAQWGAGVRTDAAQSYFTNGMSNLVCFLIGPTQAHSTAPANSGDDVLEQYIPANLDEPIWNSDGTVNANNYWAAYVSEVVTTYKPWIHIWEVWNEPDWVSDYTTTQKWTTAAPTAADLPRFNGSVFDYIRMLRITTEVAKKIDPDAKIALGGIGYSTFLSAILRYTDNPTDGSVTSDYPSKGDAYFDVTNFHYYPLYTPGNSDAAVAGFLSQKASFATELTKASVTGKSWNATETGAPRYAVGGYPGGDDYAKNYIMKVMLEGQLNGMLGIDWFDLSDGAAEGASTDSYSYMGLYDDLSSLATPAGATRTDTGWAYTTLSKLLKGAKEDVTATKALALPKKVAGGAFVTADGHEAYALWAAADPSDLAEDATATYSLATSAGITAYAWDYAQTSASQALVSSGGHVALSLTSSVQIFVAK